MENGKNMHPVDELKWVRDEIAGLKAREAELRDILLADPAQRVSDKFVALPKEVVSSRLDHDALKEALGDLAPYKRPTTAVQIRIEPPKPSTIKAAREWAPS